VDIGKLVAWAEDSANTSRRPATNDVVAEVLREGTVEG
jgi:hypothetical protein